MFFVDLEKNGKVLQKYYGGGLWLMTYDKERISQVYLCIHLCMRMYKAMVGHVEEKLKILIVIGLCLNHALSCVQC